MQRRDFLKTMIAAASTSLIPTTVVAAVATSIPTVIAPAPAVAAAIAYNVRYTGLIDGIRQTLNLGDMPVGDVDEKIDRLHAMNKSKSYQVEYTENYDSREFGFCEECDCIEGFNRQLVLIMGGDDFDMNLQLDKPRRHGMIMNTK